MNLTYAVADLHGADDLLDLALAMIERHAARQLNGRRSVVFLGDYIDRGPGSRKIIERLMAGPPAGWQWACLKGNHEDMMLQVLQDPFEANWWIGNGGDATLISYGAPASDPFRPDMIPPAHLRWIEALPLLTRDAHRLFVHAGVDPTLPLDAQDDHHLLWSRGSNAHGHGRLFVVHGHTPDPAGPVTDGRSINLDTFAWKTGRLVVAVFDDERDGAPLDFIEVERRRG